MQTFIRRLHLFTGLLLAVFVILYFGTGYVMIHEKWFPRGEPKTTSRDEAVTLNASLDDLQTAEALRQRFSLPGKRQALERRADGTLRVRFFAPGVNHDLVLAATRDRVRLTRSEMGFAGTMHGYHRLHGYGGGWAADLWAAVCDAVSIACIVFPLSGVVLWWQVARHKIWGILALLTSFGLAATTVLYFVHLP